MECSNQRGFASLIGTFHLSPHENILTIALINIHYLYTVVHHQKRYRLDPNCGFYQLICYQVASACWLQQVCENLTCCNLIFADLLQVVEPPYIKLMDKKS